MDLYNEAINRFKTQYDLYIKGGGEERTAFTLATTDGVRPSARTLLLKSVDERGFMFVTNSGSRKGRQLKANPHGAMCFWWPDAYEQVIIEGGVEPVSTEEIDAYWKTRPKESQVGAWASLQSETLDSRDTLVRRFNEYAEKYREHDVPRPPYWMGYRLKPSRIEFWKGQPHRLHERTLYTLETDGWRVRYLYP